MTNQKGKMDKGWNLDNSYAHLPNKFFTAINPTSVRSPELVIFNDSLAAALGLNAEALRSEEGVAEFAGNEIPKGAFPLAQAYAGHQFGHFTMLGDGRAVLLGEQITHKGERFDIQLKGSGRTPYSRGGDGRAALGPMLREYIISEAMYALGIPTTRSLAVVTTGEAVIREKDLPGAVLTRVAASHIRVGTFQYIAQWGSIDDLRTLADYTIKRHYPKLEGQENRYLSLLQELIKRQAELISKWQLVGFIHGVMNTDNMTISGETIDYGPCAFMDTYNPETVFSSIDRNGRYAYGNQPYIGGWNLARFAEAILPLLHENEKQALELAQNEISQYTEIYQSYWRSGMRAKLGIFNEEPTDQAIFESLLSIMEKHQSDYTNTFRALTNGKLDGASLFSTSEFAGWQKMWEERLKRQEQSKEASYELMRQRNPAVIPRNHRVEEALDAAVNNDDLTVMERLLAVLSKPYEHSQEHTEYCIAPASSSQPYRTFCGT
ncbi:YdiU family protein [Cytobacillus depressus]|uniref:Protein nucleotidyltransferase YdiU n=1 Tax=Cytobacillus depressus TaxID=1602942 RepID=A0A6L3V413_9BACI|nr:YdiU family protein [Cytobacillus depressus]KAB2332299.1 YdiU family protein [Cytobacillus depressus]